MRRRSRTRGPPRGGAAERGAQIARIGVSQAQQSCRASIAAAVARSLAVQPRLRVRPNPLRRPPKWLARRQRGNGARNAPPLTAGRRGGGTGMPSTYPMCAKGRVPRAGAAGHVMLSRREKKVQPVRRTGVRRSVQCFGRPGGGGWIPRTEGAAAASISPSGGPAHGCCSVRVWRAAAHGSPLCVSPSTQKTHVFPLRGARRPLLAHPRPFRGWRGHCLCCFELSFHPAFSPPPPLLPFPPPLPPPPFPPFFPSPPPFPRRLQTTARCVRVARRVFVFILACVPLRGEWRHLRAPRRLGMPLLRSSRRARRSSCGL